MTRVISRMTLQQILARAVGDDIILNESNVVNFEDHGDKVFWATDRLKLIFHIIILCLRTICKKELINSNSSFVFFQVSVVLENGQHYEGDLLVGADGIWSKVSFFLSNLTDILYLCNQINVHLLFPVFYFLFSKFQD